MQRAINRLRLTGSIFLVVILPGLLSACSASSASFDLTRGSARQSTATATVNLVSELPVAQCNASTGITIYADLDYASDAASAFQQQTGITTKLVEASTGDLVTRVSDQEDAPHWDVIWFDGGVSMRELADRGLLLRWKSNRIGNYTDQGAGLIPEDFAYYPSGVTAAGVIVFNKNHAPSKLPNDWEDLLDASYRDQIVEANPGISGPAYPFVAGVSQILGGEKQGKTYFQQLQANGLTTLPSNAEVIAEVTRGRKEFGIVQDVAYFAALARGDSNLGIIYPSSGVVEMPSVLGIAAKSSHVACSQAFVDWVISAEGQKVMTAHSRTDGDTYFVGLVKGVTPVVQRQTDGIMWVKLDVQKWAGVEESFKKWFDANIADGS